MTQYEPNTRGDLDDRVRLVLGDDELLITESYDVHQGVLTQPSAFSLRLGYGGLIADLIAKYDPGTKFQLYIGDALRFTGFTDDDVAAGETGATKWTITGRDVLARLHDKYIPADKTYTNHTYEEFVFAVIKDALGDAAVIASTNVGNRLTLAGLAGTSTGGGTSTKKTTPIVAGIGINPTAAAVVSAAIAQQGAAGDPAPDAAQPAKSSAPAMQAKAGERYYDFLKKELDRAGLCLWATADGEAYVLTAPDGQQRPIGRLVRKRGTSGNVVNVLTGRRTRATSKRFSEVLIFARGGGGKTGRTTSQAKYEDSEMQGWGFDRPFVVRDHKCANAKQAEYLARRKMAESRRAGFTLVYTVAGHTFPALGTGERAVWTPDTVIDVDDDEFNLHGSFYLEQVAFRRNPQTTTELTLLRPEDLVFAEDPPQ